MRTWLAIITLFSIGFVSSAQTATPTVIPSVEGYYEFESLSAPQIQLDSGWSTITVNNRTYLRNISNPRTVRFYCDCKWLIIEYRRLNVSSGNVSGGAFTVFQGTSFATGFSHFSSGVDTDVRVAIPIVAPTEIIIRNDLGILWLDSMWILQGNIVVAPTATPGATPTPLAPSVTPTATQFVFFVPYPATPEATQANIYDYVEVTQDVDGNPVYARMERGTDSGTILLVLGIFAILFVMVIQLVVMLWKR